MRSAGAIRSGAGGAFLRFGALSLAFHAALGAAVLAFSGFPRLSLSAFHRVVTVELLEPPGVSGAPAGGAAGSVPALRKPPGAPPSAAPVPASVPSAMPDVPPPPAGSAPEAVQAPAAESVRAVGAAGEVPANMDDSRPGIGAGTGQGAGGAAPAAARADAAGGAGTGEEGGPSSQARAGYLDLLLGRIERHKEYPGAARRLGHEGTVVVGFRLGGDGRIGSVAVERSSGSPILDAAALKAVSGAGRFPPPPPAFRGGETKFVLPVRFRLDPPIGGRK